MEIVASLLEDAMVRIAAVGRRRHFVPIDQKCDETIDPDEDLLL